jgi:hypothetical protein
VLAAYPLENTKRRQRGSPRFLVIRSLVVLSKQQAGCCLRSLRLTNMSSMTARLRRH